MVFLGLLQERSSIGGVLRAVERLVPTMVGRFSTFSRLSVKRADTRKIRRLIWSINLRIIVCTLLKTSTYNNIIQNTLISKSITTNYRTQIDLDREKQKTAYFLLMILLEW